MDKNGGKDLKSDVPHAQDDNKEKRDKPDNNGAHVQPSKSPKKRRKVNHACVYCRRSERPCTRCIKRNIGHLCHDEPRDADSKKAKSSHATSVVDDSETTQSDMARGSIDQSAAGSMGPPPPFERKHSGFGAGVLGQGNPLHLVSPGSVSGMPGNGSNMNQFAGFSDAWLTAQNHYHDMQNYHPNYMLAPEVTHEFNLLNEFLQTSLLDDGGGILSDESHNSPAFSRTAATNDMLPAFGNNGNANNNNTNRAAAANALQQMLPPPNVEHGKSISRPGSVVQADKDKAREYYLQAADPSGNDTPEERMDRVLKAKYEAGLLKPFNYVKGYARLGTYLDGHIAASSKQKILRTIDRFRPKFREKAQALTDMELLYVEMWFEKQLMEYDRVFASMAIPACCWRRTGEIFRGNNEMAELLHVPVESLRDGKISLHEILTEESLVRYWEEFGTIAFDPSHDTLLTACTLKNPDDKATDPVTNCCFSFMIQRDNHKIPTLIIGNFLPNDPARLAQKLLSQLPSSIDAAAIDPLLVELKSQIKATLSFTPPSKERNAKDELDKAATALWNLCTRLRREDDTGSLVSRKKLLIASHAVAFLMIDVARSRQATDMADVVHLMKLVLKTGRLCISSNSVSIANDILQKGANYTKLLEQLRSSMLGPDDLAECARLQSEYYILRVAVCWKNGKLDTANYMYEKAAPTVQSLDPRSAEKMSEVLYDIGRALNNKNDFKLAAVWLERAYDIINSQGLDVLSRDAIELRLAIGQAHIQSLIGIDTPACIQKAQNLIGYIESEIGQKPVVLLLQLEVLQKASAEVFDIGAYAEILRRMVRIFDFSEAHFKLLVYHARQLHNKSPTEATKIVDGMLSSTIVTSGRAEWVERLLLLRIWMETNERDSMRSVEELGVVLSNLQLQLTQPFGASAAVGALSLMWKKIEINYNQGQFDVAEGWCRLALEKIFDNGGPANKSGLGRKLILCGLSRNDTESARQAFHEMSEDARREPMTRYLMYKTALRCQDHQLAAECLEKVGDSADQDPNYLYACVLEAQKCGDRICAMQAMKQLVTRHVFNEASPIHLPALLRCNIRLAIVVSESETNPTVLKATVEEILAAKAMMRDPKDADGSKFFTVKELDWFCQNAYNLGLKNSDKWELGEITRLFECCLEIFKFYPEDLPEDTSIDLALRAMCCHFVLAAALVSLARTEDNREEQLQLYLNARKHVEAYDGLMQAWIKRLEKLTVHDLTEKLSTLLVFDFEAAMALKDYDAPGKIIRIAKSLKSVESLKAMGDICLRAKLPGHELYHFLGVIVNELWELEQMKPEKLARYIRCMFHAVRPLDVSLGQKLIRQTIDVAKIGSENGNHNFPREELEWLVAESFNMAVDVYRSGQADDECDSWADLAMNLAHYANDDGALEKMIHDRRMKLNFDVR
ncbi:Zinc cluster transcription factor acuM [Colletotrichum sidae]|uniref:Protein ZIP4 homolog n=1 Tax=Colletotrichum sidae TaxID=1347389 RepID=A0A4R8T6W3_9PEZI|nr:Zinc cluster transcription factor acuM [Colletotrichum sidae]